MPIRILDEATIDKIAAGEVVERPASVVKELVENAIDAGSTAITVEISGGGIDFIRVSDNGCGIPEDEVRIAFMRHATSKIVSSEDLFSIETLGFRGEALSSIAAVARFELITKKSDELIGTRCIVEGGKELLFENIGAPEGTTMIVRDLFFNTPARRKFLKSATTEAGSVIDIMEHIAILRPDIAIQLTVNKKTRFHTSGNGNLKEVIYRIYGKEMSDNIIPFMFDDGGMKVSGYLGKPALVRSNRDFEVFFVNGRFIKSKILSAALEEGYREYLMIHRFPLCFLNFDFEPGRVDVNVHPSKMEIRIFDADELMELLKEHITECLSKKEMIPTNILETPQEIKIEVKKELEAAREGKNPEPFMYEKVVKEETLAVKEETFVVKEEADESEDDFIFEDDSLTAVNGKDEQPSLSVAATADDDAVRISEYKQLDLFEEKILSRDNRARYKIIGQVFDTYWIVQFEDKMFIIDQHAAHEKVNYERLIKKLNSREITSQNLFPPVIISLNGREESAFKNYEQAFSNLGFEVDEFGGSEYAIRSVPTDVFGSNPRELFLAILEELCEGNTRGNYRIIEEKIASMACKASVKGGDRISVSEAEKLIDELLQLDNPYNCPHGRPTIISMTETELEKKFKRIVN